MPQAPGFYAGRAAPSEPGAFGFRLKNPKPYTLNSKSYEGFGFGFELVKGCRGFEGCWVF